MSNDTFRVVLTVVIIAALIAFLAITADIMRQHPAVPWFGFGVLSVVVLEALIYGIYRLVKYIRRG